ncbi:hypothetical protein UJ101_01123 [Flavobacteriaceae bacterium UJ101]|nr:hypothetical protein UJ101_01123 [Flavobacteriaceae bacterium UJ101]
MKKLFYLFLGILFLASCSEDDQNNTNTLQEVSFGIIKNNQSNNSNGEILIPSKVIITLKDVTADTLIFNKKILDLFDFNGQYLTQNVTLNVGPYSIEEYFVTDKDNKVIYASPKENSELAQYVNNPLPLSFNVNLDQVTQVLPEVLTVESTTAEQFGYATFGFNIIEKPNQFSLVAFDENNEITTVNLTIKSNEEELFNQDLEAKTNLIDINSDYDSFQLIISKEGYETQTFNYTIEELKKVIDENNLKIYLKTSSQSKEKIHEGDVILSSIEEYNEFVSQSYTGIIGNLEIINHHVKSASLKELKTITSISGNLTISNATGIIDLKGFKNLTSIGGDLYISQSADLINLEGLNNISSINTIFLESNHSLTSIDALKNITLIKTELYIQYHPNLLSLEGLNNVTSIGSYLWILNNENLTSLTALSNLTSIGIELVISDNKNLTSLEGLNNINFVERIGITENTNLIDFCSIYELITSETLYIFDVYNNSYNPTKEDILNGNCSQ